MQLDSKAYACRTDLDQSQGLCNDRSCDAHSPNLDTGPHVMLCATTQGNGGARLNARLNAKLNVK